MSISSLYTGITGLIGYSQAMSVIGNNIANVNTVGFKGSRTDFSDILSHSVGGVSGQFQVGRGVRISAVERQFSQSAFESTNSGTDLAINGEGFFVVKGSDGVNYYTRAGQFHMDEQGKLVNDKGYILQGYLLDSDGNVINNVTQDIDLSTISSEPKASTSVELNLNLDSEAVGKDPTLFDANDPSTYNYSTTLNVYDSLGNSHALSVYLIKDNTATNTWTWTTGLTDTAANPIQGTLSFTTSGLLDTESAGAFTINFDPPNVADQTITFDFGDSITTDGGAGTGTTQYSGASTTLFLAQDGYPAGGLELHSGRFGRRDRRMVQQRADKKPLPDRSRPLRQPVGAGQHRKQSVHRNPEFGIGDYRTSEHRRFRRYPVQFPGAVQRGPVLSSSSR